MVVPREVLPVGSPCGHPPGLIPAAGSRSAHSRMQRQVHVRNWVKEAVTSLNMLYGGRQPRDCHSFQPGSALASNTFRRSSAPPGPRQRG